MSVDHLKRRVANLERLINRDGVAQEKGAQSISQQIADLGIQVNTLQNENFRDFFDKYRILAPMLNTEVELKELLISSDMKETMLLAGLEDFQNTSNMLAAMDSLRTTLDKAPIANLTALEKELEEAHGSMVA